MRRLLACLMVVVFAVAVSADSVAIVKPAVTTVQPVVKAVVATAVATVKDAAAKAEVNVKIPDSSITADTLMNNASAVVNAVKGMKTGAVTLILLIAALIKLLVSVLKFPALAKAFDTPKVKPLKPYIALAIGILSGFAASASLGQPVVTSIIAGLTAGFGATGIHETWKSVRGKNA